MSLRFRWETKFKEIEFGEIPKDWKEISVGDAGTVGGGTTPSTKVEEYWDGNIPWITPNDLAHYEYIYISRGERSITDIAVHANSLRMFPKGTVLLTSRAPIGYVAIASNPVTTNQGFKNVIPNEKTSSEYILYLFRRITEYLRDISGGSTFSELTAGTLREVKIPYPESKEQDRIGTVLAWFDELIENKKRQNELLEKAAFAIFKSWFIDFEPFKSKESKSNTSGELPCGWELRPIGLIVDMKKGLAYFGNEKYEHQIEGSRVFVTLNNIIEGGGFKTEYYWIKSDRLKEHHFLREGDLIIANIHFGVGGSETERLLAAPAIVVFPPAYNENKAVYSMDITKITARERCHNYFLYFYLKYTKEDSASFSTGTSILHLDEKNFKHNKLVMCPPNQVLENFNALVEPLFKKLLNNQKEILVLRKVRDTLLPLLVFGKLRVEEM